MELFAAIRRDVRIEELSIRELARRHGVHRRTVRQALAAAEPPPRNKPTRSAPRLDPYKDLIDAMLRTDLDAPRKQRHTATRILARLVEEHAADGLSYSTVRDYVRIRRAQIDLEAGRRVEAFIAQQHGPGEEAEVDFGEVWAVIDGVRTKCHMFVLWLSHSGKAIHRVYPTQAQEAFLQGHVEAFEAIGGVPPQVMDEPRHHELARRFPSAMRINGVCGCHVHVGVATRQVAVEALLRLRPWLPPLIALTANSPIWEGEVTSWASRRFLLASRWPTFMPAPPARSVEEYDPLVGQAIASGKALDSRSGYFLARLSPRYPTIEVRAADMCLTVDEAVAYAGLVRALVSMAVDEAATGSPVIPVQQALLRRSCRSAARVGLHGMVTDPQTGSQVPAWELIGALVDRVQPLLRAHGDEARVLATIDRVRAVGGGADRQRRLFRLSSSPGAFAAALATSMVGL